MNAEQKMAYFNLLRLRVVGIVMIIIAIAAIAVAFKWNAAEGLVIFIAGTAAFCMLSFREISPSPARRAVPMYKGSFVLADEGGLSLPPGWTFFPLMGLLFTYKLHDASQRNFDVADINERTPDNGEITVDAFFTYNVDRDNSVTFINNGGTIGVEKKLGELVKSRIREWVASTVEGPVTWQEAVRSNGLAMSVLIQKLFPGALDAFKVPDAVYTALPGLSEIPLSMIVKYITGLPPLLTQIPKSFPQNLKGVAEREIEIHKILDRLKASNATAWADLERAIRSRLQEIERVKSGFCRFNMQNLGIIISLAALGQIQATEETAAAADKVAEAIQQAEVSTITTNNFKQRVEDLTATMGNDPKGATEAVQLIDRRVTKNVTETQYGLRGDNLTALKEIAKSFLDFLGSRNKPTT